MTAFNEYKDELWWRSTIAEQLGIKLPQGSKMQQWRVVNEFSYISYEFEDQWVSLSWTSPLQDLHVIIKGPITMIPKVAQEYQIFDII